MYTTGASYPGILAGQYAAAPQYAQGGPPQHYPVGADRGALLANLRRNGSPGVHPHQQPHMVYPGPPQAQPSAYDYQQSQLELQIAQMQLQNLEMQKRLLMQAADNARRIEQQQHQPQYGYAQQQPQQQQQRQGTPPMGYGQRERMGTGGPQPGSFMAVGDEGRQAQMSRDWRSGSPEMSLPPAPPADGQVRREALQSLDRAQRARHASNNGEALANGPFGPARSRLSFGGSTDAASLVEHALARQRHSSAAGDQPMPTSPVTSRAPLQSTPPAVHSATLPQLMSTPSPPRPTLVLSKPGEAFPDTSSPSPPPGQRIRHVKTDSHSSSSSSASSTTGSEVHSFESAATSVGDTSLASAKDDATVVPTKLNASASTFTPSCAVAPPLFVAVEPAAPRVTPFRTRLNLASTAAGGAKSGVVVIRQPRGPAPEEELPAKNFAARIRRRAIGVVLRGRNSFIADEVPDFGGPRSPVPVFGDDE